MTSRRDFVKLAGVGVLSATITSSQAHKAQHSIEKSKSKNTFNTAIAGYSFLAYKDNIDKVVEVMTAIGVKYISLKNFQLPYGSNKEQIEVVIGKFKTAGIEVYGLGVIYMKTEQEVDNAFNYAQMAGVKVIIVAPDYNLLNYVEKKAIAFQIRVAIHNHGPEDKLFPDIDTVYEKIKTMNPHMGICHDIGHTFRCGHDPAAMLLKYKDRIYDMHIKDVDAPVEKGHTVINGRGKMDFVSLMKALNKSGYSGMCSIEFEQQGDPALGLAESVGHFRGVMDCI